MAMVGRSVHHLLAQSTTTSCRSCLVLVGRVQAITRWYEGGGRGGCGEMGGTSSVGWREDGYRSDELMHRRRRDGEHNMACGSQWKVRGVVTVLETP